MGKYNNVANMAMQGATTGASVGGNWGAAVGGVGGAIMGLLQGDPATQQVNAQDALNANSFKWNSMSMQQQSDINYQQWLRTNYSAQVEQLKKAGLNPALMYGNGAGGGGTQGNSSSGGYNSQAGNDVMREQMGLQRAQQAAQMSLLDSQRKNIDADTKLKDVQAEKTAGVDTEQVVANIANIKSQTENTNVAREGMILENKLKDIQLIISSGKVDLEIEKLKNDVHYSSLLIEKISKELPYVSDIAKASLNNLIANTKLTEVGIDKAESEIKVNLANEARIYQDIKKLRQDMTLAVESFNWSKVRDRTMFHQELMKINNETIRNGIYKAYQEIDAEYKGKQLEWDKERWESEMWMRSKEMFDPSVMFKGRKDFKMK